MMRLAILFLTFSYSSLLYAGKGLVTVLEAPLFRKPSWNSKVVQNKRKGETIFIHPKHMGESQFETRYLDKEVSDENGFYQTLDRKGQTAFVPSQYVKLILEDNREFETPINPFKPDPTDYRLEEPLPEGYPLEPIDKRRINFNIALGPGLKNNYPYSQSIESENFSSQRGFQITYTRKVDFDNTNRFYFGGFFHLYNQEAELTLEDSTFSQESKGQLGIGPFASYDLFRTNKNILTFGGGITINYDRYLVEQIRGDLNEERIFSGFSVTPKLTTFYQRKNVITENLNLVFGAEIQANLAYNLKSSTEPSVTSFWNDENDQFNVPFGANYTVFFGVQTTTE